MWTKFLVFVVAVFLLCQFAGAAEGADSPSITLNGGFEDGKSNWWGSGKSEVEAGKAAEGEKFLKLSSGFICQDKRKVEGGGNYCISMMIRCDSTDKGSVYVQSSYRGAGVGSGWRGAEKVQLQGRSEPAVFVTGGTHDWKKFSVVVTAPEGADQILIYLRKVNDKGAAFFDDVSIVPTDEEAVAEKIIKNAGFEEGKNNWWGGKGEIVKDNPAEGLACMKINSGFMCQDKSPVKGNKVYKISMKIRCEGADEGGVYVQSSYRGTGVDGSWQGPEQVKLNGRTEPALFVTGGTHGWKEFSVVVQTPPGANQLLLYLRKANDKGAAFFDDIKVEASNEKPLTAAEMKRRELAKELLPTASAGSDAHALMAAAVRSKDTPVRTHEITTSGVGKMHIHVGTEADVVTLFAAKSMAEYLSKISGAVFLPFSHDKNPLPGGLMVIGRENGLTDKLCPGISYDELGEDGFVIRSCGNNLVITGASPRGTLNGVNWFLDRKIGVKWVKPDYTYIPQSKDISLAVQNEKQIPRFAYREVLNTEGQQKMYKMRNLLTGESHGPSFWQTPPEYDIFDHSWLAKGGEGLFYQIIPQKKYGSHGDWYYGGQVRMMNSGMRQAMANEIVGKLKALPDYRKVWYGVHQMDWGWDMDGESIKFAKQHGNVPSAPRLDMMIDLAEKVSQKMPDAKLSFNAYTWSFTPPEGMTVPDNILVYPMTIHMDYSTPLNKGRNVKLGKDIEGWDKLANNLIIWDHIANWMGFLQPTPNIYPIGDTIQWLATLPHVKGYFAEGCWNTPASEFSSLRAWLIARMTWNPQLDPKQVVKEYCDATYGKAGPLVKEYIDLMHDKIAQTGDLISERTMVTIKMYDFDFISKADELFAKAEAVTADDPQRQRNVREARMPVDFVILLRRNEYGKEASEKGSPWKVDYENRKARFLESVKEFNVKQYRQGTRKGELESLISVERHHAEPVDMVKGLKDEDWVDYQDLWWNRYDTSVIVADEDASDGAAITMVGKSSCWAMQFKLDRLPEDGEWDLYVSIKADVEDGHDNDTAVKVGFAPPMSRFTSVPAKKLKDGYKLIKVPGGPFKFEINHLKSVYLQAAAKPYIKAIYLDRMIAVRAVKK